MKKIIAIILILMLSISCAALEKEEKYSKEPFKRMTGGWESTAEKGSYYVFKEDGTFYWYKSAKDLGDNYYKGTYVALHSNEAIKDLNLREDGPKIVKKNSNGKVTEDNYYSLTLTPTTHIVDGVDKSDKLPKNFEMKMLFIYVDEEKAQAFNFQSGQKYYFKRNDAYKKNK